MVKEKAQLPHSQAIKHLVCHKKIFNNYSIKYYEGSCLGAKYAVKEYKMTYSAPFFCSENCGGEPGGNRIWGTWFLRFEVGELPKIMSVSSKEERMQLRHHAERIRMYVGENDMFDGIPVYERLMNMARNMGIPGATVLRAMAGFGVRGVRTNRILRISENMPLVVEMVANSEYVGPFLEAIKPMLAEGLVTRESVEVVFYHHESLEDHPA